MNELAHLIQQLIDWLIATWHWLSTVMFASWQRVPYRATIIAMLQTWYAAGYVTIALSVVGILLLVWLVRRWLRAVIARTHFSQIRLLNNYLMHIIHVCRDDTHRDAGALVRARRVFKRYFYAYQLVIAPDNELRRRMRDLVNQIDEDTAQFHQHINLHHAYQLQTMLEIQCNAYPRRIRWLYWVLGGR